MNFQAYSIMLYIFAGFCIPLFLSERFIYPNLPTPVFIFLACVVSGLSCLLVELGRVDVYPRGAVALQAAAVVHAVLCVVLIPYYLVQQGPDIGGTLLAMLVVGATYVILLWIVGFFIAGMLHRREDRYYRRPFSGR